MSRMKLLSAVREMTLAEKLSTGATLAFTLAAIVAETLGLAGTLNADLANLFALPLLATAALFGGIQSFHRSKTVKTVFSTAVFNFVTAFILYLCSIILLAVYLTA